ncbi:hypothetical protein EZV62_005318 [Acer yangbiense]|uniref:Uncharacterized protein n=1 Tax=Acer yangbiense TaxID=1000413 RepID=A0A5C7IM39_9ROSI|nr:hypothetical protein EZV62_005318 [Acer yangbiense]
MTDEQINENAISLEQSNTKFIWVLRYADKADIFTEECRRSAKLPEGFEKRTKVWMEFMLGEPEHRSTDCSLAYALRPTKECCADIRAMRRLMASEERDQMRKRVDALRQSFKQSLGKDEVSCMELESFTAHITR